MNKNKIFDGLWIACLLLVVAALSLPLGAQTEPSEEPASEEPPSGEPAAEILDEIVVSAELREENLQEVPISITAFTEIQIEESGIETPEDFLGLTSNITLGNSFTVGNSFVTVRGITQINNSDPSVAIVVDGVYQANQKQLNQELFDVERIEVLKGPQGSIYGRNSLGGVLNIITKEPTGNFGGFVQAGIGNGEAWRLAGSVGGALAADKVFGRFAASHRDADGWIDNVFLNEKIDPYQDTTARARLRFLPRDDFSIDLRAQSSSTEGGAVQFAVVPTVGGANDFSIAPDESFLGASEREIDDFSLKLDRVGSGWTLTSISAYTALEETYRGDLDFSNPVRFPGAFPLGQGQDLEVSYFSQELRVASAGSGDVQWLAGAYYLATDRELLTTPFLDTDGTAGGLIPLFFIGEDNDNTAYAAFAKVDAVLGDAWALTAGMRYDKDEREQTDTINGGDRRRSFDAWQPRLTLTYSRSPGLLAYLTLARGFRSGGYNAPTISPDFFDKEETQNYEVGFKSTLADGRVRFNGAVYLNQVDDFQVFQVDVATASQIISNIRDVEMQGVELDLLARVAPGLDLSASLGWNDASIEDFDGSGRFLGNQTPSNVKSTVNIGLRYSVPISETVLFSSRLDAELRGKQYWHADNLDVTDGVTFVNARLGVETGSWAFTVWGKNLFDEEFWAEYFDATWGGIPSGMDLGHPGRSRTVGFDARYRF